MKAVYKLSQEDIKELIAEALEAKNKGTAESIDFHLTRKGKAVAPSKMFEKSEKSTPEGEFGVFAVVEMEDE